MLEDLNAQVAQLVEQRIENPRVGGSIPPLGTIQKKAPSRRFFLDGAQGGSPLASRRSDANAALRIGSTPAQLSAKSRQSGFDLQRVASRQHDLRV